MIKKTTTNQEEFEEYDDLLIAIGEELELEKPAIVDGLVVVPISKGSIEEWDERARKGHKVSWDFFSSIRPGSDRLYKVVAE